MVEDTAVTDNGIEGLAKYLVAAVKCNDNMEESIKFVIEKLKEVRNFELDACLKILQAKEKEWGEVARCTHFTIRELKNQVASRKT